MEAEVEGVKLFDISCGEGGGLILHEERQPIDRFPVDIGGNAADGRHFQGLAQKRGLDDIAHAHPGDVGAFLRLDGDQTFLSKARQRLRQRLARDAQPLANLGFVDLDARLQLEGDDRGPELIIDSAGFRRIPRRPGGRAVSIRVKEASLRGSNVLTF